MHRILWWLVIGTFFLNGCTLFRKTSRTEREEQVWRGTLAGTMAERVDFETLELSGKARAETSDGGISISYRMSIAQDSVMLIKVSKFIEVARVFIDRDSIYVLDKLNQTFMACDFSLAESYTGLRADFATLQDLILGNYLPIPKDVRPEDLKAYPQVFGGEAQGTAFRYFIDPLMLKLVRLEANNPTRNQQAAVQYEGFEQYGNTQMPQTVTIGTFAPDTAIVRLNHRRVTLNPNNPKFDFEVPSNYTRVSCDF